MENINNYFNNRNVDYPDKFSSYLSNSLIKILPKNKDVRILDIGCGYGEFLGTLKLNGYINILGIDINKDAVRFCKSKSIFCEHIRSINDFINKYKGEKFHFIQMSHVLEHIEKKEIIKTLILIKKNLLADNGCLFVKVPNAQSSTGCYWAYEDFTHDTIFTSGSIIYVLKSAGFEKIEFIDPYNIEERSWKGKIKQKVLLRLYEWHKNFWNNVTCSSYHKTSPVIYSFELRVKAVNKKD